MPYLTFRTFPLLLQIHIDRWGACLHVNWKAQAENVFFSLLYTMPPYEELSWRLRLKKKTSLSSQPQGLPLLLLLFHSIVALIQDVRKCTKKANRARTFSRSNQRLFLTFLGMFLLLLAPALAACVWIMHFQSLPSQFQLQNGISQGSQRPTAAYLIELGIKWSSMSLGQMESLRTDEDGSTFLLLLPLFL